MARITVKTFLNVEDRSNDAFGHEIGTASDIQTFDAIVKSVRWDSGLFLGYFDENGNNLFLEQAESRLGRIFHNEPGYEDEEL